MNNKIIIVGVLLLLVVSVGIIYHQNLQDKEESHDIVYNPATGETFDSVEDYVYRNKTIVGSE